METLIIEGAQDWKTPDLDRVDPAEAAAILWLDRLVFNLDRTCRNPNLLWWEDELWLIDHGAALRFQYNWSAVTEATPHEVGMTADPHVFEAAADADEWPTWDSAFSRRVTRAVLEGAVAMVPESFLLPLLPGAQTRSATDRAAALRRRRAAYVAFPWKRLKPPRAFAMASPVRVAALPRRSGVGERRS